MPTNSNIFFIDILKILHDGGTLVTPYSATMEHSEATIRQLSKTQYNVFGVRIKLTLLLICCLWLYFGLFSNINGFAQIICLMGGCFTAVSLDMPAKRNADKILAQLNGKSMKTHYTFYDDGFSLGIPGKEGSESPHTPYANIIRLVEDRTHYYLFISKFGAYMIDKSTVSPDLNAFHEFMQSVCHQKWSGASGLLGLSLKKLKATR